MPTRCAARSTASESDEELRTAHPILEGCSKIADAACANPPRTRNCTSSRFDPSWSGRAESAGVEGVSVPQLRRGSAARAARRRGGERWQEPERARFRSVEPGRTQKSKSRGCTHGRSRRFDDPNVDCEVVVRPLRSCARSCPTASQRMPALQQRSTPVRVFASRENCIEHAGATAPVHAASSGVARLRPRHTANSRELDHTHVSCGGSRSSPPWVMASYDQARHRPGARLSMRASATRPS